MAVGLLGLLYWVLPHLAPTILGWMFPAVVFRVPASERVVYLTIDDAPSGATPAILAVLSKHHVPATFFVIGSWVGNERQLEQIRDAGCLLGHHMWTTKPCTKLTSTEFQRDFDATARRLKPYEPKYFRPPSGFGTDEQLAYVRANGLVPILGTAFPLDSSIQKPALLRLLVQWLVVPGAIVIMHDGNKRGWTTADVLDQVIPDLKSRGYQFRALPVSLSTQALKPTATSITHRAHARLARAVAHLQC